MGRVTTPRVCVGTSCAAGAGGWRILRLLGFQAVGSGPSRPTQPSTFLHLALCMLTWLSRSMPTRVHRAAKDSPTVLLAAAPDESPQQGLDPTLAVGAMVTLIVHRQLISEQRSWSIP